MIVVIYRFDTSDPGVISRKITDEEWEEENGAYIYREIEKECATRGVSIG